MALVKSARARSRSPLARKTLPRLYHNVVDNREISEFSDAELSAILRGRVGVVAVESDEERPDRGALN